MEAAGSACAPPRGEWTPSSTIAARKCILQGLHRDLQDWRRESCGGEPLPPTPDLDATLCRIRVAGMMPERAGPTRHSLTNMMLVRSLAGRLSAATLLDRGDEGGPMRHWPARTLGALHMLAELQFRIDKGWLPKLPDFVAILNPHDGPEQIKNHGKSWCGTIPLLSNSRIAGRYFDLMAPDFSFAPFGGGALTNGIYGLKDTKTGGLGVNGSAYVVPTGWDDERRRIYEAGRAQLWAEKAPTLFWRGGETNGVRRAYVGALNNRSSGARPPADVLTDVHLCAAHCAPGEGAALVDWCRRRLLLSLPGATFAIGFKYTLLCSSLVVRGGIKEEGSGGGGDGDEFAAERAAAAADNAAAGTPGGSGHPGEYEQFWHAGLRGGSHYITSKRPDDLGGVVAAALDSGGADVIARRGGDYVYQTLTRDFVAEYWHRLFAGQASLYSDWSSLTSGSDALLGGGAAKDWKCSGGASRAKLGKYEKMCVGGGTGCHVAEPAVSAARFEPIPPPAELAAECATLDGAHRVYRRFARPLPPRFAANQTSELAVKALDAWLYGGKHAWRQYHDPRRPKKS